MNITIDPMPLCTHMYMYVTVHIYKCVHACVVSIGKDKNCRQ